MLNAIAAYAVSQSLLGVAPYPDGGFYTQLNAQTPPLPGQVNLAITQSFTTVTLAQALVDMELNKLLRALNVNNTVIEVIDYLVNKFLAEQIDLNMSVDDLLDYILGIINNLNANQSPSGLTADLNAEALGESWVQKIIAFIEKAIAGAGQLVEDILDALGQLIVAVVQWFVKAGKAVIQEIIDHLKQIFAVLKQFENVFQFLLQLADQHCTSYYPLLGMGQLAALAKAIINHAGTTNPKLTGAWEGITEAKNVLSQGNLQKLWGVVEQLAANDADFLTKLAV